MNTFSFRLCIYLEVELLDHMVTSCLIVWETIRFFQSTFSILHSYQQYVRVPVSFILATLVISCFCDSSHPSRCKVVCHCGFVSLRLLFFVYFLSIHTLHLGIHTHKCWLDLLNILWKLSFLLFFTFHFSKCPAGTCDGCTFYFLWESAEACPLCTEHDFHEIEGACKRGLQVRSQPI